MKSCVLDSSAVLAFYYGEKGIAVLQDRSENFIISSVNFIEVKSKLILNGDILEGEQEILPAFFQEVVALDLEQAHLAADLITIGKPLGLSLGDRVCLALALLRQLPVYTADHAWASLDLPIAIHLIR